MNCQLLPKEPTTATFVDRVARPEHSGPDRSAATSVPLHPLLAERWSPRAWSETPVSTQQLRAVLEAARWAPSAGSAQRWRFVVGHRGDSTWDPLLEALNPGNQQ